VLGIKTEFIDGQRVTTKETMRVVEMVLSGRDKLKEIVSLSKSLWGPKAYWEYLGKMVTFLEAIPKGF